MFAFGWKTAARRIELVQTKTRVCRDVPCRHPYAAAIELALERGWYAAKRWALFPGRAGFPGGFFRLLPCAVCAGNEKSAISHHACAGNRASCCVCRARDTVSSKTGGIPWNLETAVKNLTAHGFSVRLPDRAGRGKRHLAGAFRQNRRLRRQRHTRADAAFETLQKNNTVYWHWKQTPAQALENARSAQVYLTSANAVSETGEIVNIDGTGNRVASMLYGHEALYIVAGVNKLAPDLASAMDRARSIAAPLNARRLQRKNALRAGRAHALS